MNEEEEFEAGGTPCFLGLVLRLDFEQLSGVIEAIQASGARVVYRRTAPPWSYLRIVAVEGEP